MEQAWDQAQAIQRGQSEQDRRVALLEFGYRYFPHYCSLPASVFHRELCAELVRMLDSEDSERLALAAPRGNAKTTWSSLIFPVYCIVYSLKRFIVLISNTASLADSLLEDIRTELEENTTLRRDYPAATGRGPRWRETEIVTANGIKVISLGTGKRIRGRKHRQWRPDLVCLDDFENDEHVRNPEQRDKLHAWLTKVVLKAKGVAEKADYLAVGTLLHFDAVLARLIDQRQSPGWRGRVYRAVKRWAERQDLWDRWQELYTDWSKSDEDRLALAHRFYAHHETEMLRGTEVLWPEGESYYTLMRTLVDEGRLSFDSEKQNEPINPEECQFREEWFEWFDEVEIDGEAWLVPEHGERVRLSDCDVYGATDPSMGKQDKHRDPSAIVSMAGWPSTRIERNAGNYRTLWVLDGDIRRRHPHTIQQDIYAFHRLRRYRRHGVEAIQFQELFAEQVQDDAMADDTIADLHIVKLKPRTDKALRIQKLGAFIYSKRMRFSRRLTALYNQLRYWPQAPHDDGPDALELCLETMGRVGWAMLMDQEEEKPKHPYREQVESRMPRFFQRRGEMCGECAQFTGAQAGSGRCGFHDFLVQGRDVACEYWEGRLED